MTFDAIVLAESPHANEVLLGLTLAERGVRVARKAGARRVHLIDTADAAAALAAWDAERGNAGLMVIRAGDQLVHRPLVEPLLRGSGARRIAVGPDGYAGALWVDAPTARSVIDALATSRDDAALVAGWSDAERIEHGDIARHAATTPAERKAAVKMLLRILVKVGEDSPISQYIYRPLSQPLTRLLLHTPITPNQVSYIVAVIGLVGCWFTAQPDQTSLIVGAGLVFISGIIDGCDGEIARLRLTSSSFGAWLDTIVDETTTTTYFVAIGIHTYHHLHEPWVASSIAIGAAAYITSIYAIYYFCIVVLKAGGSQYYVGSLDVVETEGGVGLRPKQRAERSIPPALRKLGTIALYLIRRDFINLASFGLTFIDGYPVIYFTMLIGGLISAVVIIPEHLRLRRQLREVARRGGTPRLIAS